jgi:mono/diheme cytochrome c family protein
MWRCSLAAAAALLLLSCAQYPTGGSTRLHLDMVDQASFRPQENPRPLPEGSVPVRSSHAPALEGKQLMLLYCTPCHGASAKGDGRIAAKMSKPADLTSPKYAAWKDEEFYQAVRRGSGLMPSYSESLSSGETRLVAKYIRSLRKP